MKYETITAPSGEAKTIDETLNNKEFQDKYNLVQVIRFNGTYSWSLLVIVKEDE